MNGSWRFSRQRPRESEAFWCSRRSSRRTGPRSSRRSSRPDPAPGAARCSRGGPVSPGIAPIDRRRRGSAGEARRANSERIRAVRSASDRRRSSWAGRVNVGVRGRRSVGAGLPERAAPCGRRSWRQRVGRGTRARRGAAGAAKTPVRLAKKLNPTAGKARRRRRRRFGRARPPEENGSSPREEGSRRGSPRGDDGRGATRGGPVGRAAFLHCVAAAFGRHLVFV